MKKILSLLVVAVLMLGLAPAGGVREGNKDPAA